MNKIYWFLVVFGILALLLALPVSSESYIAPVREVVEVKLPIKEYAKIEVEKAFGEGQWVYLNILFQKESNWNSDAQNKNSTAFGIPQFLNSTWKTVGCIKTSDPYIQISCGLKYIKSRHQNPQRALEFHKINGWY